MCARWGQPQRETVLSMRSARPRAATTRRKGIKTPRRLPRIAPAAIFAHKFKSGPGGNLTATKNPHRPPQAFARHGPHQEILLRQGARQEAHVVKKHVVPAPPKSQYELERDERIKRNEKFMLSIGLNPYGSGGYVKQNTKKAPPKQRAPKKYVPESAPPLAPPGSTRAPDLRLVGRRRPRRRAR